MSKELQSSAARSGTSLPRPVPLPKSTKPDIAASDEPTVAKYVWTIVEGWPTVLAVIGLAVALGTFYLLTATPIYRTDAVVQVEPKTRGLAGLEDLIGAVTQSPADTEMAIVRSRSSLGSVVEELGLDVSISPRTFPIVGSALARRHKGPAPASAVLGLTSFAWGGERLKIRRIDVPDELLEVPLQLTATGNGAYRIDDAEGTRLLEGREGTLASADVGDRKIEVFVTELAARPGTRFIVTRHRRSDVAARLQRQLRVSEDGRMSGILIISLDGPDPARISRIVNAVANNYLHQNVDRKSAEAQQQLAFLESQLPIVKQTVTQAEAAYNKFLSTHGTVNLSNEAESALERSAQVERELTALELQRSELRQRFTESHPSLASLNEKAAMLRSERAQIASRMQRMPEAEANSARLQNDLRVATELYTVLLNKAQELRVVKSGTVGNVRILDQAIVPHRATWPDARTVLALSILLGAMGGVATVFLKQALARGIDDAEEIESSTGLAVYATIPHTDAAGRLVRKAGGIAPVQVLAAADPQDLAIENIRSLRTSLQFALVEAPNNIIAVTGPAPGVGKSFVCVNLAYVLASADQRVLIIDADLRRGRLHRHVGATRKPGLSDVLSGSVELSAAVRRTDNPLVDVLPTGSIPPNAAELLSSHRFESLLEGVSRTYGYVLLDTPPVLAVTDAAIVARLAGVNLLILRAGQHSLREVALSVKRFAQAGGAVHGAVLNDVRATAGRYGKHGRYQRYEYRSETPST